LPITLLIVAALATFFVRADKPATTADAGEETAAVA
jgi:hypothetical protein